MHIVREITPKSKGPYGVEVAIAQYLHPTLLHNSSLGTLNERNRGHFEIVESYVDQGLVRSTE
jgi:hypothetical protein